MKLTLVAASLVHKVGNVKLTLLDKMKIVLDSKGRMVIYLTCSEGVAFKHCC